MSDYGYTLADRLLGKTYSLIERLPWLHSGTVSQVPTQGCRDIVLIPFGMGIGNTPITLDQYLGDPELIGAIYDEMGAFAGFDLREYETEVRYGNLHDGCCWAVADDLYHTIRLLRDLKPVSDLNLLNRLQLVSHSAGIFITGWLAGILSLEDMMRLTHECGDLMVRNELESSVEEVNTWMEHPEELGDSARHCFTEMRKRVDPDLRMDAKELATHLHGKIQFLFCPTQGMLADLLEDVQKQKIDVHLAMQLSPHCLLIAGNALETERFYELFTGARRIAIRRVTVQIRGTSHCPRFEKAAAWTRTLMESYDQKNRLKDPVVPFLNWQGEWVQTKKDFIEAVAGNSNHQVRFDKMIKTSRMQGGKHYVLLQSGMAKVAGDVFDGIIRADADVSMQVDVYKPVLGMGRHPLAMNLIPAGLDPHLGRESYHETVRWYEGLLEQVRKQARGRLKGNSGSKEKEPMAL